MAGGSIENSGGRSEFDIDDERDSARTIAASFFHIFQSLPYHVKLVSSNCIQNLSGAFNTH